MARRLALSYNFFYYPIYLVHSFISVIHAYTHQLAYMSQNIERPFKRRNKISYWFHPPNRYISYRHLYIGQVHCGYMIMRYVIYRVLMWHAWCVYLSMYVFLDGVLAVNWLGMYRMWLIGLTGYGKFQPPTHWLSSYVNAMLSFSTCSLFMQLTVVKP